MVKKMVVLKQLNLFECPVLTHKNTLKNQIQKIKEKSKNVEYSEPVPFKALQHETSVSKYYVELKEDVFTEQGYLDLAKVPSLYVSGAGQFLKNLRKKNGLIQKDIAKIIGVSRSQVCKWENNWKRLPLQSLVKIVETLGVIKDTIYSLIDQGKITTKNNLPVKFERLRNIVQYFNPFKDDECSRITLLKCCPDEILSKIKETLNVKPRSRGRNWKTIACRELYNFLTTFFQYTKASKIHPPLTTEVKGWYKDSVDLKRAVIIPCLQSDGCMKQYRLYYKLGFYGNNKVLHDYFVDAMYYEYNELPSIYFTSCLRTEYYRKSTIEIANAVMNLAGNVKTSPAHGQTAEEYLKEPQPHLNYLRTASVTEQQIALRIWASTEGSISVCRKNGCVYPELKIGCSHPDLARQLQQIARRFNINFSIKRSKGYWAGLQALSTLALSSCINFLKLGNFIKGVKISSSSPYHEGIAKDVLLLGILEFKKRELENRRLKKLPIQQVHHKINKIVENRRYRSRDYYVNYFS
jgi:transcriptional regulator with XRE-family HTH domain